MSVDEFSLIQRYFSQPSWSRRDENTLLGIGDDAAVVKIPENHQLVQTIDTLVAGRHFPSETDPNLIAHKSLAVNVSDLVAMAATPAFFLLSLTLPTVDETFLKKFSAGLFAAADEFGIHLIGGDTCKGPLSITIQANGYVPQDEYVTRSGARIGDRIFVSGKLGTAALGLACLQEGITLTAELERICIEALNKPGPRLDMIPLLRNFANSAIDLSDGLAGDLKHILEQSGVGCVLEQSRLPVIEWIREQNRYALALQGGDDYQILFTLAQKHVAEMLKQAALENIEVTEIGIITETGFILQTRTGAIDLSLQRGFDHFAEG